MEEKKKSAITLSFEMDVVNEGFWTTDGGGDASCLCTSREVVGQLTLEGQA